MLYNAQLVNEIITDERGYAEPAQVGVDLTVQGIAEILGTAFIPKEGKTVPAEVLHLIPKSEVKDEFGIFALEGGKAYAVTFDQGLKTLQAFQTAFIIQRSSLNRNGCLALGSVFDPGYGCANLGCTLYPTVNLNIQLHARIAQIIIMENHPAASRYAGQYNKE